MLNYIFIQQNSKDSTIILLLTVRASVHLALNYTFDVKKIAVICESNLAICIVSLKVFTHFGPVVSLS